MAATTMLKRWVLVGILALTAAAAPPQQKIKHFVTVMLENRAFDHRIGLFKHPGMEGVPADAYNMLNGTSCKVSCLLCRQLPRATWAPPTRQKVVTIRIAADTRATPSPGVQQGPAV